VDGNYENKKGSLPRKFGSVESKEGKFETQKRDQKKKVRIGQKDDDGAVWGFEKVKIGSEKEN